MNKRLFFLLSVIYFVSPVVSQEDKQPNWSHTLAGGMAIFANSSTYGDNGYSFINYQEPGYFLFYRAAANRKFESTCITFNTSYRSALGDYSGGGLGGGSTTTVSIQWLRADLGVSEIFNFGKEKNFGLGLGAYAGGLMFSHIKSSIQYQYPINTNSKPTDVLSLVHLGLNVELRQKVRVNETNKIVIGLRAGFETPEGFESVKPVKQINLYIGYELTARKKSDKVTSQK